MVGAGLLQAQAGAGEAGLGKYLSTGPEDKNWERKQAKANEENKARLNEENKGSFFANLLPKLGTVHPHSHPPHNVCGAVLTLRLTNPLELPALTINSIIYVYIYTHTQTHTNLHTPAHSLSSTLDFVSHNHAPPDPFQIILCALFTSMSGTIHESVCESIRSILVTCPLCRLCRGVWAGCTRAYGAPRARTACNKGDQGVGQGPNAHRPQQAARQGHREGGHGAGCGDPVENCGNLILMRALSAVFGTGTVYGTCALQYSTNFMLKMQYCMSCPEQ